ncbi:hypothetical protein AMECASPLE_032575 [Ameca splendens]|uniref:Uncharacterized protein n=1 Tax=Ameca splendens TaxID=208324 RepID=A0ABV0YTT5_9TELE
MHQLGKRAGPTNRPRPSTTHQPLQCRYKTCSIAPPTRSQPCARWVVRATEESIGRRPPQHTKDWGPRQPYISTPEVPQYVGCTHSLTAQVASPSTIAKSQPNPPQLMDRALNPGTEIQKIQTIQREPKCQK